MQAEGATGRGCARQVLRRVEAQKADMRFILPTRDARLCMVKNPTGTICLTADLSIGLHYVADACVLF